MAARKDDSSATHFLNVDLDIYSMHDLQPLVHSFGRAQAKTMTSTTGARRFEVTFELTD